jgi:tRNA threonylcarbamoyladenosine biosynthesis protein TsaB
MRVLGIEAATPMAGAAVVEDGRILAETVLDVHRAPAERLLGQVERVLEESATALSELAAIAVSVGPGSFTGIRVGISTARGLAGGSGVRLVGVPTLESLAAPLMVTGAPVLAALDARRHEVYYAVFAGWGDQGPLRVGGPGVARPEALAERLGGTVTGLPGAAGGRLIAVGSGAALVREALERAWPGRIVFQGGPAAFPRPSCTAWLGALRASAGVTGDVEPLYVRRSDAEEARHGGDRAS